MTKITRLWKYFNNWSNQIYSLNKSVDYGKECCMRQGTDTGCRIRLKLWEKKGKIHLSICIQLGYWLNPPLKKDLDLFVYTSGYILFSSLIKSTTCFDEMLVMESAKAFDFIIKEMKKKSYTVASHVMWSTYSTVIKFSEKKHLLATTDWMATLTNNLHDLNYKIVFQEELKMINFKR